MAEKSSTQQRGRRKGARGKRLKSRSDVWPHFTRLRDEDGNETGQAECNRCRASLSTIHGTTSLRKHLNACGSTQEADDSAASVAAAEARPPPPPPPPPLILQPSSPARPAGAPSDVDPASRLLQEASEHLARMIALGGHDPLVLEDDFFRSFVASLNPEFRVPSRVAIEEMCNGIFDEARVNLWDKLDRAPGKVSLAVGKANTLQLGEVMYIACHFIDDDWKLHRFVLDAFVDACTVPLEYAPTLGVHFFKEAAGPVVGIVSHFKGRLSVVAYDITYSNFRPEDCDFQKTSSRRNTSCSTTTTWITYRDNVLHSIARCLVPGSDFLLRTMYDDMKKLNLTGQERLQLLSELDPDYEQAYDQPWCLWYYSLELLGKRGFPGLVHTDVRIQRLCKVWKQVYRAIQKISAASNCPTSNLCLAELLKLREILQDELKWFGGDGADVQDKYENNLYEVKNPEEAFREATGTLDEAIQESYLVWSVPLALDPRYKLSYIEFLFKRVFPSEAAAYVSNIKTNINKMYADYIEEYGTVTSVDHSDNADTLTDTTSADPLEQAWIEHRHSQDVMAAQVNSCSTETQTELDRYLRDPLVPVTATQDFDVLNWWKVHSSEYPMVAQMARDALAMPTCSKLSREQLAHVRSIIRGYSKTPFS